MESLENKLSLILRTDVTAVKLFHNLIFVGIGSWIHVYHKLSGSFLYKEQILRGQKIYAFQPSQDHRRVLIYGGKQFAVTTLVRCPVGNEDVVKLDATSEAVLCDDWLHAAVWTSEHEVALLTAHNIVQMWDTSKLSLLRSYPCKDNSILYSGLLVPLADSVLVFAGTVFSDVIIRCCSEDRPLHNLKGHRGVIFSIACDLQKQIIVTTSDDRSLRVWGPKHALTFSTNTKEYWSKVTIECKHELYGHSARPMRCGIVSKLIISVGEDSAICFWDLQGNLLRKSSSHQNGSIWALDADKLHLVTGGGDSGVILHPLTVALEYGDHKVLQLDLGNPKKIAFTARRNTVILSESDLLYYYDVDLNCVTYSCKLKHESTCKLLSISSCKQLIAVADMAGNLDIFSENCKGEPSIRNVINTKLNLGKILSMHWAGNRHLVICDENGTVTVMASRGNEIEKLTHFVLPPCKERWLTATAVDKTNGMFALGDRCGHVHIYDANQKNPVRTFKKVHGRYGPTSITMKNNKIITTGRDGTIKHFDIEDGTRVKLMNSTNVNFEWVEKFLDKDGDLVCGFQERVFVVYDIRNSCKLLEVPCGGGHRSWDAVRYMEKINDEYETFISLIYLKNAAIHVSTFQLSTIISKHIVAGSHTKEINCLKCYTFSDSQTFFITGGEDTTLRVSLCTNSNKFHDKVIFKNLSSVRTLKTFVLNKNKLLIVSAGGRAQICIKVIEFLEHGDGVEIKSEAVIDHLIKGSDKERKSNQNWRNATADFDPETRIMDVDIIRLNDGEFLIPAGCSDACLRIFKLYYNPNGTSNFKSIGEIKYHKTCILRTHSFKFQNEDILVTCTTRGEVAFWNVTQEILRNPNDFSVFKPFFVTKTNKSGINSIAVKNISESEVIFATGGDDNTVHLNFMKLGKLNTLETFLNTSVDNFHSSEITGLEFVDEDMLLSTSVDQRVTLSRWTMEVGREGGELRCQLVSQCCSDVADIQGMHVLRNDRCSVSVCVFGKGFELLNISKPMT